VQELLLVMAVVLNSLILVGIIVGLIIFLKRFGKAADDLQATLADIRKETGPTLVATQDALKSIQSLAAMTEKELGHIDGVLSSTDRILSGAAIAEATIRAVKGSRMTASSLFAGIKEGLRVLKSRADESKEDSKNV
jgi:hypothetical protein